MDKIDEIDELKNWFYELGKKFGVREGYTFGELDKAIDAVLEENKKFKENKNEI